MLALPGAALAAAPTVVTSQAFSTGATTAEVDGAINPAGQSTTYQVQYDLASSGWCQTQTGSPANTTSSTPLGFSDNSFHDVAVDLPGLTADTAYCAQVTAANNDGQSVGGQVTWTQGIPVSDTFDAFSTGATTATVEGDVNPSGQSTTYAVEYDDAGSLWCTSGGASGSPTHTVAGPPFPPIDSSFHSVSVDLTTLTGGTHYCAEIVATNGSGTSESTQTQWTQGTPLADTFTGFSTGATTATVQGDVDPVGQTTTYGVQYDVASSDWCTSFGASGSPANTKTAADTLGPDLSFHLVSVDLTGLTAGTAYCAQVIATNGSGETGGGLVTWSQPPELTVNRAGSGSGGVISSPAGINCGSTCSASFDQGTQVTLTPTPAPGSVFAGWSGGGCSGTGTCKVTLNSNTTVTATFNALHTLTVSKAGSGSGGVTSSPAGINCGSTCAHVFTAGTQVTLTATAAAGSTFAGWSGGGCSGTGTCKVTVINDTGVTATFNTTPPVTHTLTVSLNGSGSVTSSPAGINCGATCSHGFTAGTPITLIAAADSGSTFSGWSGGGCSGTGNCVVTLNSDTAVTATFAANPPPPPTMCIVPKLKGKTLAAAKRAIKKAHCSVGKITKVASSAKNRGRVVSQSPKPGKHLKKGSKVALKVGK